MVRLAVCIISSLVTNEAWTLAPGLHQTHSEDQQLPYVSTISSPTARNVQLS